VREPGEEPCGEAVRVHAALPRQAGILLPGQLAPPRSVRQRRIVAVCGERPLLPKPLLS
jgi:hypothetical protein